MVINPSADTIDPDKWFHHELEKEFQTKLNDITLIKFGSWDVKIKNSMMSTVNAIFASDINVILEQSTVTVDM